MPSPSNQSNGVHDPAHTPERNYDAMSKVTTPCNHAAKKRTACHWCTSNNPSHRRSESPPPPPHLAEPEDLRSHQRTCLPRNRPSEQPKAAPVVFRLRGADATEIATRSQSRNRSPAVPFIRVQPRPNQPANTASRPLPSSGVRSIRIRIVRESTCGQRSGKMIRAGSSRMIKPVIHVKPTPHATR